MSRTDPQAAPAMNRSVYFDHYRLATGYDGAPVQLTKVGAAVVYKATDTRSGAPVALTCVPEKTIEPVMRERFAEKARTSVALDHLNVARTLESQRDGDEYIFISEYPQGETLDKWIADNGPMSPDAVLRIGLQVISALNAASFHHLHHRGIEPSNIKIVSGQTAEGGWPAIKLLHLPVAGMTRDAENGEGVLAFGSPEQLRDGTVDFRSEIYSLGTTMCFLLTGVFYSGEPRSLQTRRFAGPLRQLIAPMLRQNPDERPQDPVLVAQELRSCLARVERRQMLANRFGIPFVPVKSRMMRFPAPSRSPRSILAAAINRPVNHEELQREMAASEEPAPGLPLPPGNEEPASGLWWRRAVALAAILLVGGTVAAMLLPAPVGMILHGHRNMAEIGVPVGVPQHTATPLGQWPAAVASNNQAKAAQPASSSMPKATVNHPHQAAPMIASASPPPSTSPRAGATPLGATPAPAHDQQNFANAPAIASNNPNPSVPASPQSAPPAEGPQSVWEQAAGAGGRPHIARADSSLNNQVGQENSSDEAKAPVADESNAAPNESASPKPSPSSKTTANSSSSSSSNKAKKSRPPIARAQPVAPYDYDSNPPIGRYGYGSAPPSHQWQPQQHVYQGSFPARFVGITPDGNLILRFPDGQTAIVPARAYHNNRTHRRRVIIERRYVTPQQPFYPPPFYPPDA